MKISVIAHPNSKKPRIEKDLFGGLHVYVNAPPLEGRANKEVIESLSAFLSQPKSKIRLIKGERSKSKLFEISD